MKIRDEWTWLMILFACLSLIADFIFFRYRGHIPPEDKKFEDSLDSLELKDDDETEGAEGDSIYM